MNKSIAIQQNKLFTSYGGVGSMIDTIDDLSLIIEPFDQWNKLYNSVCIGRELHYKRLQLNEARLCSRIRDLGFSNLQGFFRADTSFDEESSFKAYCPNNTFTERMVKTKYFPRWFYCPRCHRFMPYEGWRELWNNDKDFESHVPACRNCHNPTIIRRPKLMQTRFVMASMESGEIRDIPWDLVFHKGDSDSDNAPVWVFNQNSEQSEEVYFYISDASTNLSRIYVKNQSGQRVLLSTIFRHYIVMDENGRKTVYKPLVRSENNIYYNYNLSSIYIPLPVLDNQIINQICQFSNKGRTVEDIRKYLEMDDINLTIDQIQAIIDDTADINHRYESESQFREEEFDFITGGANYDKKTRSYSDPEGKLKSYIYSFNNGNKPSFIKNVYYQTALNVTTVQIAYSRIDKISLDNLNNWKGRNDPAKIWYNPKTDSITEVDVALKPICQRDMTNIQRMPAMSATGEGMMFELNLEHIPNNERHIFMHTFCHLLMKELEFVCGYPIASMNERLYAFEGKYGFLIYAVGGSSGSYGGLSSLFISKDIEKIISNCLERSKDCSNDPICSSEGGACFACVQIPETSCEMFNNGISRNILNKYI